MTETRWQTLPLDESFSTDPKQWLKAHARPDMPYALIHADDGVIWGKRQADGTLSLSGEVFSDPARYPAVAVELRPETLQQVRLFGPAGELFVWRTREGFAGRSLMDGPAHDEDAFEQAYLLWHQGQPEAVDRQAGFALLQEGGQGPQHAPPVIPNGRQRPRLVVRHYVDYDDQEQAYIALSRLVNLEA